MRVRSPYTEQVRVRALDDLVVDPGDEVDVDADLLPGFLEASWVPADPATEKAAARLAATLTKAGRRPWWAAPDEAPPGDTPPGNTPPGDALAGDSKGAVQ